jgi:hypothetical protein
LDELLETPLAFTGDAKGQVERILAEISRILTKREEATSYIPGEMR